jgi:hypothetical protein
LKELEERMKNNLLNIEQLEVISCSRKLKIFFNNFLFLQNFQSELQDNANEYEKKLKEFLMENDV